MQTMACAGVPGFDKTMARKAESTARQDLEIIGVVSSSSLRAVPMRQVQPNLPRPEMTGFLLDVTAFGRRQPSRILAARI
ncbi:hypothetical protein [Bradyrhizobium sp. CCH5-F6]|uniref:hypothetical protein n=1 Tax=Bradyrhizobium sp. CCH5-F6 TaxID=1768753 RepID=UPI0018D23C7F|nr:hypothetical protein [Bradyrhizobium sp. CCH5-F6]